MVRAAPSGPPPRPALVLRLAGSALLVVLAGVATTCHLSDLVKPGRVSILSVALKQLEDSARAGSTTPRVSAIAVGASADPIHWSVRPLLGSAWLRPSVSSGMAPDTLTVALDPSGLAAGVHQDTLVFTDAGPTGTSIRVPVMFRVTGCTLNDVQPNVQISDTLRGTDCAAPHKSGRYARLYRFSANANDSMSVWLSSTAFDAYLVLDSSIAQGAVPSLVENDACHAGQRDACLVYVKMPQTGSYVVEVTSAAAGATGAYSLIIAPPRPPAAPDTLAQFANDLVTPVPAGGVVSQDTIALRASLVDPDSDSVQVEVEVRSLGTAFSGTPTATSGLVASGARAMAVDTGLANYTSYHWQARAVDRTGRRSAWTAFGGSTADFRVVVPQPPNVPVSLGQFKIDGATAIAVSGTTDQSTVLFRGLVTDPDSGDQVRLEVEVKPVGTAFANAATGSSLPVPQGNTATATITGLSDSVVYHWQARAVDQTGRASAWTSFGGNAESTPDFTVALAPAQLVVITQPATTAAGGAIATAVAVQDAGGKTLTSFTGTVTVAIGTNPGGGTLSGTTSVAAVAGVATFSNLSINKVGTGYTLAFSSGALAATSAAFDITPGAATALAFLVQPSNVSAGGSISPPVEVAVRDAFGNLVTGSTAAVTIALGTNPSGATLGGTLTQDAVAGVATFPNLTVNLVGSGYTLAASSGTLTGATSSAFNVTAGTGYRLVFTTQPPASATAGVAFGTVVTVRDSLGNTVTSFNGAVSVAIGTNPGGGTLSGTGCTVTCTIGAVSGVATFNGLSIDKAASGYLLTASSSTAQSGNSATFTVTAATASQIAVNAGNNQTSTVNTAVATPPSVIVKDQFGNVVGGVNVTFAVATGGGTVVPTTAVVSASTGIAAVTSWTLGPIAGTNTLTATSAGLTGSPVTFTATGTAGVASKLAFTVQPTNVAGGATITPAVAVTVQDANGNTVTSATNSITVAIGTNPSGGTLSGTNPVAAVSGVATFSNLSINKAGTGYTLTAATTGLTGATSTAFNVTVGAASKLAFTVQPANVSGGATITPAVVVQVQDAGGNLVTTATNSVTMAIGTNPSSGTLSGTLTVAASGGVATFSNLSIDKAGTGYTLTAASTGLTGATSSAFNVTVGVASKLAFTVQPTNVAAGAVITPAVQVQVQDAGGNLITTATNSVTVAIGTNPSGGTLSGTLTVPASAGVASFSNLSINKAGNGYTLTAAATGLTGATSNTFSVTSGTATQLAFTQQPTTVVAGVAITPAVTVAVQDAQGNTVTSATNSITMAIGTNPPGNGILSGTNPKAAVNGVATFSDLSIDKAGNGYTLTAAATGLTTATSSVFNILASSTVDSTQSTVSAAPTTITGSPPSASTITVTAKDKFGNAISGAIVFLAATGSGNSIVQPSAPTNASGVATGTFSSTGVGPHTISANVGGVVAVQKPTVTVNPALVVTVAVASKSLTVNTAYTPFTPVTASGGTTPYTFGISPALPAGMSLSTTTGQISGTPTATLTTTFTVTVTDAALATGSATFSLTVNPALAVTQAVPTTTLTAFTAYTPFIPVTASAGTTPYAFANSPALPAGMNFSTTTGTISGTPTATLATTPFTVTVTDAAGATGSATFSLTVNAAPTTTTITGHTPNPSVTGQGIAVTFTVTAAGGTPTGNVTVSDGTVSCVGTVAAGTCTLTATTAGAKTLTGTYAGDGTFAGSVSAGVAHTVSPAATTTTITSATPNPSLVGQAYTVTYTVAVTAPGGGTPTGNVTVSDGTVSCVGTVAAGTCTLTSTTTGAKTLTATYAGDANFAGSVSAGVAHTVNAASTTTTITGHTPNPSVTGQGIAVTFTVTSAGGTPTGNVTVSDGTVSCVGTVAAGNCTLTPTTAGAKTLTATYAGDANFAGSVSAGVAHTVNKAATTTTITGHTPNPSVTGQGIAVTFTVTSTGGTPTGNVTVSDGTVSCVGTVAAGACTLTPTTAGAKTLTATYAGDANFAGSVSASVAHTVNAASTTTTITGHTPDPSVTGQGIAVTFTVAVTAPGGGTPTGNVTVSDGTDSCVGTVAAGSCTLTATTVGSKTLTATYAGDANFSGSASAGVTHTVNAASTTTTITNATPEPSTVDQAYTVTFTVAVTAPGGGTPTGNVTVSDGTDSCVGTVAAGSCSLTSTTAGAKTLTATYAGDANFAGSVSATFAHTVN